MGKVTSVHRMVMLSLKRFKEVVFLTQTDTFLVPESIRLDIAEKIQKIHTNQKENLIIVRYKPQKSLQKPFWNFFLNIQGTFLNLSHSNLTLGAQELS